MKQPVGVVGRNRPAAGKINQLRHLLPEAGDVVRNLFLCQHPAHLRLAGGVADHPRPAAEQQDGRVPRALQVGRHHDGDIMPDVKAVGRRVEADVERRFSVVQQVADFFPVRGLGNQSSLFQFLKHTHFKNPPVSQGDEKSPLPQYCRGRNFPRYHLSLPQPHGGGLKGTEPYPRAVTCAHVPAYWGQPFGRAAPGGRFRMPPRPLPPAAGSLRRAGTPTVSHRRRFSCIITFSRRVVKISAARARAGASPRRFRA